MYVGYSLTVLQMVIDLLDMRVSCLTYGPLFHRLTYQNLVVIAICLIRMCSEHSTTFLILFYFGNTATHYAMWRKPPISEKSPQGSFYQKMYIKKKVFIFVLSLSQSDVTIK
uniref:Uncharacterized protein n=1 Tax=Cacopsylla melanoneura TaxID=428564 RepID=A0A8D9BI03_9HEMI